MANRRERAKQSVAAWFMLLFGVATPGVIAVAAGAVPSLDWFDGPEWASGFLGRVGLIAAGVALCAAAIGFVMRKAWAWWIVLVWGLYCVFEIARDAISNPLVVTLSVPQVIAVAFLGYVWQKRGEFGVRLGGSG
ncbi:MAG: hypothetical protein OEU54_12380 [Gemmatimonadota bacterium]|nr:hypothetical protein [Gemmatimonadota bacterium]